MKNQRPHTAPAPPRTRSVAKAAAPAIPARTPAAPANLFAGTSGWAYRTWKPGFYPDDLTARKFLSFYASRLNAVEVNYTFRKLPTAAMLEGWLAETGPGFRFCFKAPQGITHFKRLKECNAPVQAFLAALEPARLAGKLGVVLFQLPPNFKAGHDRLAEFLALPALAASRLPIAFEFRHESWFADRTYALLRAHGAALCIAGNDDLQTPEVHTASAHTCFRLRHTGGYKARQLSEFAEHMTDLARERAVYVFFKHEEEPAGALNAVTFLRRAARGRTSK